VRGRTAEDILAEIGPLEKTISPIEAVHSISAIEDGESIKPRT